MPVALLGVNILVALAWRLNGITPLPAGGSDERSADGWATCALTQNDFIRTGFV
jgi:hypothetical protein